MQNHREEEEGGREGVWYLGAHDADGILFGHGVGHFERFGRGVVV